MSSLNYGNYEHQRQQLEQALDLDPRWEWVETTTWGDPAPRYIKGACRHLDPIPVESVVTGETVAYLCPTCNTQIEAP